jgi:hypothetical protein
VRPSITRKIEAAVSTLTPDERVVDAGFAWVFAVSGRVPKLLRSRRRCVVARTERRLVVWPVPSSRRQLVGVRPLLGAPLGQLTVERFARARVLAGLRIRTTAGAVVVLELTPGARAFGSRLATAIDAVPVPAGAAAVTAGGPAPAGTAPIPPRAAATPTTQPALSRGEVLKVVTDLRDGRLAPGAARAWAVAVAGTLQAEADAAGIGDIVARLATDLPETRDPPETTAGSPASAPVDRAQLDAWVARLSERS